MITTTAVAAVVVGLLQSVSCVHGSFIIPSSSSSTSRSYKKNNFVVVPTSPNIDKTERFLFGRRQQQAVLHGQQQQRSRKSSTMTTLYNAFPGSTMVTADAAAVTMGSSNLMEFFLQTVISNGVPAVFTCSVIAFAAWQIGSMMKGDTTSGSSNYEKGFPPEFGDEALKNPAADLYRDLYGNYNDDDTDDGYDNPNKQGFLSKLFSMFSGGRGGNNNDNPQRMMNRGIPAKQYIQIQHLNEKYDSYEYSLQAASQSKAKAAATYRSKRFDRALTRALQVPGGEGVDDTTAAATQLPLSSNVKTNLIRLEKEFLKEGLQWTQQIQAIQTQLTRFVIDEEMEALGIQPFELDPVPDNATTTSTTNNSTTTNDKQNHVNGKDDDDNRRTTTSTTRNKHHKQLMKQLKVAQEELFTLEMDFIAQLVELLGKQRATGIRMALLGDISARGTGGLLTQLQQRPLSTILQSLSYDDDDDDDGNHENKKNSINNTSNIRDGTGKSLYVTKFNGDIVASQVTEFREEVTAIIRAAKPGDEALVVLQTGGGTVTGYGLAASQLLRFKEKGMKLTIAVEQVAASGGYMMCCVADHIIGSPFAVFGSIGVISETPNVYERLKKEGIEFQTVTAGKYKRTITPTKKVTKEDFEKTQQDLEDVLLLFRNFVEQYRPSLNLDEVATGETWLGTDAVKKGLCDEIRPVDDVLNDYVDHGWDVYEVEYSPPMEGAFDFSSKSLPFGGRNVARGPTFVKDLLRWLVQTIAVEIRSELTKSYYTTSAGIETEFLSQQQQQQQQRRRRQQQQYSSVQKQYMALDDNESDRIRMER